MRETGPIRADFFGDTGVAKAHLGLARTMLGILKNRMVAGGLQQLVRTYDLENGTRIVVSSAFGQDAVRIISPVPVVVTSEETEKKILTTEDLPQPYMWVGARIRWEDYPDVVSAPYWGALTLMMIEPGANGLVMSNDNVGWSKWVGGNAGTETVDLAALQASFSASWVQAPATMHNFQFYDNTVGAAGNTFMFTKHGLRLYDVMNWNTTDDTFLPYDPKLSDDNQEGDRVFFPNGDWYYESTSRLAWDQVITLDPFEEAMVPPSDKRDPTNWSRRLLERSGMASGMAGVIPGIYALKIAAWGDPRLETRRAAQTSPNLPGYYYDSTADFREYLYQHDLPLRIEVEVRLGKAPRTTINTFTVEVPDYDDQSRTIRPYGNANQVGGCDFTYGTNPHAANWWQGALLIDVIAGAVSRVEDYVPDCFAPAEYNFDKLYRSRFPADIYITNINGWSGYGSMEANFANNIAIFLDKMCTAYYGSDYEIQERTVAEIQAIAPTSGSGHFLYDVTANTFTYLGGSGTTVGTPPNWFLPFRLTSRAACRGAFWIDAQSGVMGSGIYALAGDPDLGNACCPDVFF